MDADNLSLIRLSIDPLTFVLHSTATFGMVLLYDSLITSCSSACQPLLAVSFLATGIFPLLDQLRRLMFIRYSVAYAVNPATGRMEFHHQGYKSFHRSKLFTSCRMFVFLVSLLTALSPYI